MVWTDDFSGLSADNPNPYDGGISIGYVWINGLTGIEQRLTATTSTPYGYFTGMTIQSGAYALSVTASSSTAYTINEETKPNAENFGLVYVGNNTYKYRAGVTYKYFISRAWWNVGGVANAE
jgi:hypothetical protein